MADDTKTVTPAPGPDAFPPTPGGRQVVGPEPAGTGPGVPADTTPASGIDETVPGGAYMVNGVLVDAEGNPVADKDQKG